VRTYSPKPADITRAWWIVDADGLVLGRLATEVASRLRGKHKPIFAPHADVGDHVVVINADKVVLTSGKADSKLDYRHSGYPGGLTATRYSDLMIDRADQVVRNAICGMLPKNRLGRQMATKLKVYVGADHPHAAQSPEPLELPDARRTASTRSGA
jgi:large subunit ribosomal protein L13